MGRGLLHHSEAVFAGKIDIQTGCFDDSDAVTPQARIQMPDAPRRMAGLEDLPSFERYPGM